MLLFEAMWGYLPFWMVKLIQKLPIGKLKRFHSYREVARQVAKDLIQTQTEQYVKGNDGGKDMLSILSTYLVFFLQKCKRCRIDRFRFVT